MPGRGCLLLRQTWILATQRKCLMGAIELCCTRVSVCCVLRLSMREHTLLSLGARCAVGALWPFLLTSDPTLGRLW